MLLSIGGRGLPELRSTGLPSPQGKPSFPITGPLIGDYDDLDVSLLSGFTST